MSEDKFDLAKFHILTKKKTIRDLNLELDTICHHSIDGGYKPDKKKLDAIRHLIENKPKVSRKFVEKRVCEMERKAHPDGLLSSEICRGFCEILYELGYEIDEEKK